MALAVVATPLALAWAIVGLMIGRKQTALAATPGDHDE
jgi:hypothetical protein